MLEERVLSQPEASLRNTAIDWKRVTSFVVGTYTISWAIAMASYLSGARLGQPAWVATTALFMITPAVVAIALVRIRREPVRATLGIRFRFSRWWLFAWLGPVFLIAAVWAVGSILPGVHVIPSMEMMAHHLAELMPAERRASAQQALTRFAERPPLRYLEVTLVEVLLIGPTLNAVPALGEEAGWRGFLFKELAPLGFWRSSFLVGIIWGVWHAPIIAQGYNYPEHPIAGVAMMVLVCILLAPLFTLVRAWSGSVLACSAAHGVMNGAAALATLFLFGSSDLVIGLTGFAGLFTLAVANIALAWSGAAKRAQESALV